ncbi:MAG: DMT family transporter [Pseudomonadota bacterium]
MTARPPMPAALTNRLQALTPETRGVLGMAVATFFFITMDSFAKGLGEHLPPMMVVWARYLSQTLLLMLLFAPSLRRRLVTTAPGLQLLRGALLFTVTALFFSALAVLPLAEAIALVQVGPLFMTALAALILAEKVGPRRWAAVAVGLLGALLIIRPGLAVFQPAALLALSAAFCFAAFQVLTRYLGGADAIWTTMLWTSITGLMLATATLPWTWAAPTAAALPGMVLVGAAGLIGHAVFVWAIGQVPASVLAPFNYLSLLWAMLAGLVIFGEVPEALTLLGAAIIVSAGIYVWHRERRAVRPPSGLG